MTENITLEKINEIHAQGFSCAQIVFAYGAEKMGLERETALKIAGAFGGGMYNGETCGCVTGALMALGLKYAQYQPNDPAAKSLVIQEKTAYETKFKTAHQSLFCRDLLGYNFGIPEEKALIMEKGLIPKTCPNLMLDACRILDEML